MISNVWKAISAVLIGFMLLGLTLMIIGVFVVSTTILIALAVVVFLLALLAVTARKLESRLKRAFDRIK